MNRRFVITALLGSFLIPAAVSAPAAEEAPPATQDQAAAAAAPAEPASAKFPPDKLDQLVGPIALYPDPLLIQVLIASTYPLEIVEADRWRSQHKELKDDALTKALEGEDWDPSIEGLTQFPDLLKRMSDNLDWTKDLGDAFLAQKNDVLDAVQRMRKLAQDAGTLRTSKQQTVTREVVHNKETIIIQPAEPQVVYVPTYPPTAYGAAAPPPYYPATYGYTGAEMATASLLSFGVGVGVGALISDGCDWDDHDVHVNNNYYGGGGGGGGGGKNNNSNNNVNIDNSKNVTINKNDRSQKTWQHNPEHRRNVGYRDPGTAKRYEGQTTAAARQRQERDTARGFDQSGMAQRPASGSQRPGGGGAGRPPERTAARAPDRGGAGGRPAARPASATTGGRDGAFGGYGDAGATRSASQRGAASRGGQSWAGGGGGGGGGGQGGRGGGGGGGRRGGGGGGGGGRGGGGRRR